MWRGSLYLTDDVLVMMGRGRSEADAHAHYAAQLTFAWDGHLRIRTGGEELVGHSAVPAGQRHRIEVDAERIVMVMAEPCTAFGRAVDGATRSLGLRAAAQRLEGIAAPAVPGELPAFLAEGARALTGEAHPAAPPRTRHVARALGYVRDEPPSSLSLTGAAAAAGVSPSRLTHLFSAEMGIPFSRYVLWSRFRGVVAELADGSSLTRAAAAAGFSDASHLSRSFRQTFGIAPSALAGVELHVDKDDRPVQVRAAGAA